MRGEIVRLENVLASRIAARANQDTSNMPLERSSKIEKYVEVMELTKCLRRQKEFLLSENRKRQRFAEKIQQAMPVWDRLLLLSGVDVRLRRSMVLIVCACVAIDR